MELLSLLEHQARIDAQTAATIANAAKAAGGAPAALEDELGKRGISQEDILKAKSDYFQMPARLVGDLHPSYEILRYIPEESARYYGLVPLGVEEGSLSIGIVDP